MQLQEMLCVHSVRQQPFQFGALRIEFLFWLQCCALLEFLFGYRATCWLQCNSYTMYKLEFVLLRPDAQSICTQWHAFHLHCDKMRADWWFCFISAVLELRRILSEYCTISLWKPRVASVPFYWSAILSRLFLHSQDSCMHVPTWTGPLPPLGFIKLSCKGSKNFKEADKSPVFH